ncbi:hypothetical protein EZV62_015919 [Acer yangbiense]|uniref:Uncharacterized protein n=1 Tax=Acer yangbiense TaxID=1000413 RepID=A0A5C7HM50_9ROSI|nr:hypothetical protein EZV62_015919 [Acer yangbiense]
MVLLEGCLDSWVALEKWDRDSLVNVSGNVRFSVGPVEMRLEDYFRYSYQVKEERPLYLFDPKFSQKVPILGSEFEVPVYFREDLFSVLGNERPDYRRNLLIVLDFLKRPNASTLVSGTRDRVNLHDKFKNAIEASFPGTIDQLMQKAEEKKAEEKKPSFWDSVTDSKVEAFKFSF